MSVINPTIAFQLIDNGDGTFICQKGDGGVLAVRSGALVSEPYAEGDKDQLCTKEGPFLIYQPGQSGTKFYVQPGA